MRVYLAGITLLFLLAAALLGCHPQVEQAPVTEQEPRLLVSLPPLSLNADGSPVAEEEQVIEVPAGERLTLELAIDASDADAKPSQSGIIKILLTTQTGKTVTMDSQTMKANDQDNSTYTYQGDMKAPKKPGEYSINVKFMGKEFCRHKLRVVASDEK